jgi:hypothetical protein
MSLYGNYSKQWGVLRGAHSHRQIRFGFWVAQLEASDGVGVHREGQPHQRAVSEPKGQETGESGRGLRAWEERGSPTCQFWRVDPERGKGLQLCPMKHPSHSAHLKVRKEHTRK